MSRTLVAGLLALLAITCAIHVAYALPNPNPNPNPNSPNPNQNQNPINPINPNPNPINPSPPHANIVLSIMKKFKNGHTVLTFVIKNAGNAVAERAELNVSSNFVSFSSFLGDIHPGESKAATVILNQTGKYTFHITVSYFEGLQEFSKKFERIIYSGNKNESGIYGMNENKSKTGKMSETKDKVVINLRSDVTEVKVGQEFSLTLSVVNLIGNPNMTLQVVLQPPSGMSIVSSEFAQTGVGQYTGVFHVKPGGAKAIKIDVVSNNPGNFTINGVIAYYFGKDKKNTTVRDVCIPIRVVSEKTRKTPGFELIVSLLVLILVIWRRHR